MGNEKTERGLSVVSDMLGSDFAGAVRQALESQSGFAPQLVVRGVENAFAECWGRPQLDRRSRSVFTLGILMALGTMREFRYHVKIGVANGLTVQDIEELIYHGIVYAGYPAASQAKTAAEEELRALGLID